MKIFLISLIAKAVNRISRFFGLGAGVTWPGEIGLRIDDSLIKKLAYQIRKGVIIVAGTNGKTTTASMIEHILSQNSKKVIHNATGANLRNGIAGTLLLATDFLGRITADFAIFEVDEATFPRLISDVEPKIVILLNLFRDQLDRYGEVDTIAQKWTLGLKKIKPETILVANADDPLIAYIGKQYKGKTVYFGLNSKKYDIGKLPHATDSIYCLSCGNKLFYKAVYLSHFGDWYCKTCKMKRPKLNLNNITSPLIGVYNYYNSLASALTCQSLGINNQDIHKTLLSFKPAFGRQEEFIVDNKKIKLFLSKNPAGFNESIRTVLSQKDFSAIIFALNDRIADGTDVSWIWDVDFDEIVSKSQVICTGDRYLDMALRIKYAIQNSDFRIQNDLKKAIKEGLEKTKKDNTLYIFPTYTAMLDLRKILTGKKIS